MKKIFVVFAFLFVAFNLFAEEESYEREDRQTVVVLTYEPVYYYRPYKAAGISLLAIGLAADLAGGIVFYTGMYKDDDPMMYGGLITSLVALPVWITGAVLFSIRKPVPESSVELRSFSVSPVKGGAYASLGLNF